MENSLSSCINKTVASKGTTNSPEESGWTAYLEDFSSYEGHSLSNSNLYTSSMVSDAASSAAWKNSNTNDLKIPKRLSFKKARTKIISFDESLEDTASSPVSSPKVSELEPGDHMNPRKAHDHHIISSLSKAGGTLDHYPELQSDERKEMNFGGKNNHDYADLRKRGLCLVPLSKLVNYFG